MCDIGLMVSVVHDARIGTDRENGTRTVIVLYTQP